MSVLKLSDIVDSVSESISRGTKFDTSIPRYVRKAIMELERTYDFPWMKRRGTVTIPADTDPGVFTFPDTPIKKIEFVRYDADGRKIKLKRAADRMQFCRGDNPSAYWLNSLTQGEVDAVPDADFELETGVLIFTAPLVDITTPATAEHDIFDVFEDGIANLALLKMAHLDDAEELFKAAQANYDREVKSLINWLDAQENSDRESKPRYAKVYEDAVDYTLDET